MSLAPKPPRHLCMSATLGAILGGSAAHIAGADLAGTIAAGLLLALTLRIMLIDLKVRVIFTADLFGTAAVGFGWLFCTGTQGWTDIGWGLVRSLSYAAAFEVLRSCYRWLRGRDGLGFGDVKLVAALGPILPIEYFPLAICGAAATGLIFVVARGPFRRRVVSRYTYVPFGTVLAVSSYIIWFLLWM